MEIKEYFSKVRERAKKSRVYSRHQMTGLMIASMLGDEEHKAFYIKLAREYDNQRLLEIAKSVTEKIGSLDSPGAYFMKILSKEGIMGKISEKNKEIHKPKQLSLKLRSRATRRKK